MASGHPATDGKKQLTNN